MKKETTVKKAPRITKKALMAILLEKGVDAQIVFVDLNGVLLIRFSHDRHCACGCVNTALRFGVGHSLHSVRAGLEFEFGKHPLPNNSRNNFFIATMITDISA